MPSSVSYRIQITFPNFKCVAQKYDSKMQNIWINLNLNAEGMVEGNGCAKQMNNSGLKRVNYCQALFIYKYSNANSKRICQPRDLILNLFSFSWPPHNLIKYSHRFLSFIFIHIQNEFLNYYIPKGFMKWAFGENFYPLIHDYIPNKCKYICIPIYHNMF